MELNSKKHKAVCAVALCSSPKEQTVVYHQFPLNEEVRKKSARNRFDGRSTVDVSGDYLP